MNWTTPLVAFGGGSDRIASRCFVPVNESDRDAVRHPHLGDSPFCPRRRFFHRRRPPRSPPGERHGPLASRRLRRRSPSDHWPSQHRGPAKIYFVGDETNRTPHPGIIGATVGLLVSSPGRSRHDLSRVLRPGPRTLPAAAPSPLQV